MKNGDAEDKFGEMSVNLARHNLEVTLKRTKEQCYRAAKEIALESAKGAKKMDAFVRSQYGDEPQKIAEWDKIMQKYEFLDEEDEDEE
jgi:thymidine phosphorylase